MAKRNKSIATLVLVILAACVSIAAWAQPPKTLRVGALAIVSHIAVQAAVENGYFRDEGVKAEIQLLAGTPHIISALVGGSLEAATTAYPSLFAAQEAGMELIVVSGNHREVGYPRPYTGLLVREDSGIRTIKDLEGKIVAVAGIKTMDYAVQAELMSRAGADPKKVQWTEMPFPTQGAALRAKTVDAFLGVDPFYTVELEQGGVRSISNHFADIHPKFPVGGWVVMESWRKKNPEMVEGFARAIAKGIDFLSRYPEKRGEIVVRYTRMKPELAAKLQFYPIFDKYVDGEALQMVADLAFKWDLLRKKLDVKRGVVPGILK